MRRYWAPPGSPSVEILWESLVMSFRLLSD
jgi:hypothetical protein